MTEAAGSKKGIVYEAYNWIQRQVVSIRMFCNPYIKVGQLSQTNYLASIHELNTHMLGFCALDQE